MSVHNRIIQLLDTANIEYREYRHEPCASSEESAEARRQAGAGDTVGAKALLVKSKKGKYHVLALPGHSRLDSKKVRQVIGKHSFAKNEEMEIVADGLQPGHMPPFGPQLFREITSLIIDKTLQSYDKIGFNAGDPTISIVMTGNSYQSLCEVSSTTSSIIVDDVP